MFRLSYCIVAFASILLAHSASGETVRVAIFEQQSSATISAPGGVLVKEPGTESWRRYSRELEVVPISGGFELDSRSYPVRTLTIRGNTDIVRVNDFWVKGTVKLINRRGKLLVVNHVDIEEYLVGVLSGEVPSNWHMEALKSQAIASRTYARYQIGMNRFIHYDLVATTMDQVYHGALSPDATNFAYQARLNVSRAVNATRGQFVTFDGQPILAAFHSTSAGPTEDALQVWSKDLPYLTGVACPWDKESKYYNWTRKIPIASLEKRLRAHGYRVGSVASMTPMIMTRSGRVGSIRILHSKGELVIRGEDFRKAVGYTALLSTHFKIEHFGKNIVFRGKGAGHGVGLCQWGAKELAESGFTARAIVQYYYPGTVIQFLR